jgi:hypothetical protein
MASSGVRKQLFADRKNQEFLGADFRHFLGVSSAGFADKPKRHPPIDRSAGHPAADHIAVALTWQRQR